ncbi:MAG: signal recognition particle-docking protein FtsY [Deltaproteobacteria bacterium]|nr:signal recognition particle-docking protein FtsY [Deltaproteobacteria bacterium]
MEVGIDKELIGAAVAVAAFLALVLLLIYAIRRARRARQREIESAGEDRFSSLARPKRTALRVEDVVPDEAGDEAPVAEPSPASRAEAPTPPPEAPTPPPDAPRVKPEATAAPRTPVAAPLLRTPEPEPHPAVAVVPTAKPAAPEPHPPTEAAVLGKIALPVDKPRLPEIPARRRARDAAALAPGLARTKAGWVSRLGQLFTAKREIDPLLVEEIEKVLLTADIGVRTSQKLLEEIRSGLGRRELADPHAVWSYLRSRCVDFLHIESPPVDYAKAKPFVLLAIGVNGSGKTTTIGKLAAKLKAEGKSVLLAAGDTFRAAAAEQLEVWGARVAAPVVRGKEGGDPSSVVFDAIKRAASEGIDVVIADTAGRLHTKANLMDELQKVGRVARKALAGAPHETWLVVDATSGQNAIAQAQIFTQAMSVSGIVLTKLDGTAKGGVILGIADQLRIPVRFIGIGERVEDLREFDAEEFVEALFEGAYGN